MERRTWQRGPEKVLRTKIKTRLVKQEDGEEMSVAKLTWAFYFYESIVRSCAVMKIDARFSDNKLVMHVTSYTF